VKIKQVLNSVNIKHIRRLLGNHYHRKGPGRKPINPMAMLKAQLLKHLLRIDVTPSVRVEIAFID